MMSTIAAKARKRSQARADGERRWVISDVTWEDFEILAYGLPDGSPFRLAFDGKDIEIMVASVFHNYVGWLERFSFALLTGRIRAAFS